MPQYAPLWQSAGSGGIFNRFFQEFDTSTEASRQPGFENACFVFFFGKKVNLQGERI
jgi:hypothetical protein